MHAGRRGENPESEAKALITVRAVARGSAIFFAMFSWTQIPTGHCKQGYVTAAHAVSGLHYREEPWA